MDISQVREYGAEDIQKPAKVTTATIQTRTIIYVHFSQSQIKDLTYISLLK